MGSGRQYRNLIAHQCGSARLRQKKRDSFKQKYCYDNLLEAIYAIRRTEAIWPGFRWMFYECLECGFIHIGRTHPNTIFYGPDDFVRIPAEYAVMQRAPAKAAPLPQKRGAAPRQTFVPSPYLGSETTPKTQPWIPAVEQSTRYRGYRPFQSLGS